MTTQTDAEEEADKIMLVLQEVLVAIDNALLRGALPQESINQLHQAAEHLKEIGVNYPMKEVT